MPAALVCSEQTLEPFRSNLSGKTVMALVNALQHNPPEMFNQHTEEPASRFMKIRSIWPFPVKSSPAGDHADSELPGEEAGDSVTPSSFIT